MPPPGPIAEPPDKDVAKQDVGRRLSYWISKTLKDERIAHGISEKQLSEILGVSENTIKRIEKEESFDRNTIDTYIAGYAYALGIDDPRELWQTALEDWRAPANSGSAPEFRPPDGPTGIFARAIRETSQRQRQSRVERKGKPSAIRRKATGL